MQKDSEALRRDCRVMEDIDLGLFGCFVRAERWYREGLVVGVGVGVPVIHTAVVLCVNAGIGVLPVCYSNMLAR